VSTAGSRLVRVNDRGYPVGEDHHRARFTDHEVELMIALVAEGLSFRKVAEKFECSPGYVKDLTSGRRRSQLITRTVRRILRLDEPDFFPADACEFDVVAGFRF
jgi:hypothetical protein